MKKLILLVVATAVILSGCSTPVRNQESYTLTQEKFYSDVADVRDQLVGHKHNGLEINSMSFDFDDRWKIATRVYVTFIPKRDSITTEEVDDMASDMARMITKTMLNPYAEQFRNVHRTESEVVIHSPNFNDITASFTDEVNE